MITIIDYDAGNLKSVEKAFLHLGKEINITREKKDILKAEKIILPGVGAFGEAMGKLHQYDLVDTIKEVVKKGIPFMGICLGMQLLFSGSEETKGVEGLSLLEGTIKKIPKSEGLKIPHMGWNSLEISNNSKLLSGLGDEPYVYFVHSYYLCAKNIDEVAASTFYSTNLHVAVEKDNLFGCQFHPEKSGKIGLKILENFANI